MNSIKLYSHNKFFHVFVLFALEFTLHKPSEQQLRELVLLSERESYFTTVTMNDPSDGLYDVTRGHPRGRFRRNSLPKLADFSLS